MTFADCRLQTADCYLRDTTNKDDVIINKATGKNSILGLGPWVRGYNSLFPKLSSEE